MASSGNSRGEWAWDRVFARAIVRRARTRRRTRWRARDVEGRDREMLDRAIERTRRGAHAQHALLTGLHDVAAGRLAGPQPEIVRPSRRRRIARLRRSRSENRIRLHDEQDADQPADRSARNGADRRGVRVDGLNVEPPLGSTPPWAGVTPAPGTRKRCGNSSLLGLLTGKSQELLYRPVPFLCRT